MNKECSICLNIIDNSNLCITNCNHDYCYDCLIKWLEINKLCPNCRTSIESFLYKDEINRIFYFNNVNSSDVNDIETMNQNIQELRGILGNINTIDTVKYKIKIKILYSISFLFFSSTIYYTITCNNLY